jgi:hypothetical protein
MNTDMKKQTAIEWLLKQLEEKKMIKLDKHSTFIFIKDFSTTYELIVHQAKAMEREQIVDAYNAARNDHHQMYFAEEYYNETYGGDK